MVSRLSGYSVAALALLSLSSALAQSSSENRPDTVKRDPVGDLNAEAIRSGTFPGSILIPGDGVSLAIGGFVKTVVIADSSLEGAGPIFLPAYLGTTRDDNDGNFSIDASLSRIYFDGRLDNESGAFRAYLEFDANGKNDGSLNLNFRHIYGTWASDKGTLTVGHTWSKLMDLKVLTNALTEPTVSGAIFSRQPQFAWSQRLNDWLSYDVSVEDPSSDDIFTGQSSNLGRVSVPDVIGAIEAGTARQGHLRVAAIHRTLKVDTGANTEASDSGWGVSVSGHRPVLDSDRLFFQLVRGKGLGRYLLGIQSTAGAAIDPLDQLALRKNSGGFLGYRRAWNERFSSVILAGRAKTEQLDFISPEEPENTSFFLLNLTWQVMPQLTLGAEYQYGERENFDGSSLDNHRFMVGFQIF